MTLGTHNIVFEIAGAPNYFLRYILYTAGFVSLRRKRIRNNYIDSYFLRKVIYKKLSKNTKYCEIYIQIYIYKSNFKVFDHYNH